MLDNRPLLSLSCARHQSGNIVAAQENNKDDQRGMRGEHRPGHLDMPDLGVVAFQSSQHRRCHLRGWPLSHCHGNEELVPGHGEDQDSGRDNRQAPHWQQNPKVKVNGTASIQRSCLIQLIRKHLKECRSNQHCHGCIQDDIGQDQALFGVIIQKQLKRNRKSKVGLERGAA